MSGNTVKIMIEGPTRASVDAALEILESLLTLGRQEIYAWGYPAPGVRVSVDAVLPQSDDQIELGKVE